ncbi:hypothetical protein M2444_004720 [Paenibacillus sp. PastF-3]|uniref:hypothetical protein n=1 Tax=Paenibacillus sp. PastF-3 TaxID=2940626 RepID=UPI002475D7A2|nr:hypothetical protein [Paenibacillus sp. PastF-3]MDH6372891.1 hypothetical protein [Paenibacillus sp. PastF-3]
MKNVMVRAWEIAKGAVTRFGGKVKEYLAQSLAMAWSETKEVAADFGLITQVKDRSIYVVVDDIVGLEVYSGYAANIEASFHTGTNGQTGKKGRLYNRESFRDALTFVHNGVTRTLKIKEGVATWL